MILRLFARLLWGTTKFSIKHIVIPVAYTAALAALASAAAEKIREDTPTPNGHSDAIVAVVAAESEE